MGHLQSWIYKQFGFLRDQARCAIESVDGRLFVDTIFSADRTVWPVVCKEYECQYGAPLIKDLAVFGEDSALFFRLHAYLSVTKR